MTAIRTQLTELMLDLGTFGLRPSDPVTWASGAVMPVYNDNRRLLSHPRARNLVATGMARILESLSIRPAGIVGTATGGIAPATTLADVLDLRLYYVRPNAKDHGLGHAVEGLSEGDTGLPVVLVEDLVSTGGSSSAVAGTVHAAGLSLSHGCAVFSYGFARAGRAFDALPFGFTMHALLTLDDLIEAGSATGRLGVRDVELLREWQSDPFGWAQKQGSLR